MRRKVLALFVPLLLVAPAAYAADEVRHSGTIVEIGPNERTLMMEEMVAWTGPGTGLVKRSVALTPETSIDLLKRSEEATRKAPGWESSPLKLSDLRPGDFITVTTGTQHDRAVAVSIQVVRPISMP